MSSLRLDSAIGRTLRFFLGSPALFHQREQMLQRFLVTASFFGGKLAGTLVELRGHVGRFFGRASKGHKDLGELRNFHGLKR